MKRPNILWICADQQRYDTIHCLNNPQINTPNIDKLCAEGVAFTHAHCQNPICSPSRASFLTGLYPGTVGVNRNGLRDFPEKPHIRLITQRLADAGYDCGLAGKLHIASAWNGEEKRTEDGYRRFWYSHGPSQGLGIGNQYLDWLLEQGVDLPSVFFTNDDGSLKHYRPEMPPERHQTTWCADRAIEFMQEQRDSPWLMSVNVFDPHPSFDAPAEYADRYDPDAIPAPLFKESDLELETHLADAYFQNPPVAPGRKQLENKANYYGMIELIDWNVGRMIQALEDSGQRENTVVVFMSDHGEMLGDHGLNAKGCRFYEGLVRVPLILSWPGEFSADLKSDALVELVDVAPTLAALAGVEPGVCHGQSLLPILRGDTSPDHHRDSVRCEYYDTLDMDAPYKMRASKTTFANMYRDTRYKLCVYHGLEEGQLYDLQEDPDEFHNLWNDPETQPLKLELMKKSFDAAIQAVDTGPPLIGRY